MIGYMPRKRSQEELDEFVNETFPDENTSTEGVETEKPSSTQDTSLDEQIEEIFEKGTKTEEEVEETEEKEVEEKKEEVKEEEKPEEKKEIKEEQKEEKAEEEKEKEKKEEEKKEETEEEKKEEEISEKEKELLKKFNLTKFKSLEDALEAYKNLESAYGKVLSKLQAYQKGAIPEEAEEGLEAALKIASQPQVKFEMPDPQNYYDNEGNFDINTYMQDVLQNYTLNLQKSLIIGPLASALYTVQKAALEEKYSSLKEAEEIDKAATDIVSELKELFPDIEKDTKKTELFQKVLAGERQLKGEPLTKDEIFKIAGEIFGQKTEEKEETKPIEKQTVSSQMKETPSQRPKNKLEEAVDEIFEEATKRAGAVF